VPKVDEIISNNPVDNDSDLGQGPIDGNFGNLFVSK